MFFSRAQEVALAALPLLDSRGPAPINFFNWVR